MGLQACAATPGNVNGFFHVVNELGKEMAEEHELILPVPFPVNTLYTKELNPLEPTYLLWR